MKVCSFRGLHCAPVWATEGRLFAQAGSRDPHPQSPLAIAYGLLKEISFCIQDFLSHGVYPSRLSEAVMKKFLLFAPLVLICASLAVASDAAPLKLLKSVDLPKYSGDFDHFAADVSGNRLFLAAEDHGTLEVFDLNTTKWLKTIKGFEVPHSILYLPGSHRLFVTDGGEGAEGMSKVLNEPDLQILQKVLLVPGADSMVFDPQSNQAYVATGGK